ncbi:glycosyl hydrolase [Nocardioides sp. GY 10127]|uniref:GH39 family glycosyl hydrolase n=1 Tax=Nocardioides sp. GY 10127 TaxID=2569762 RepID=UPI0010A87561|nr:glycosyl hydrolase [Nocardioides sp. GY 10127]TIC84419.1 xylan 1,4-beta-xylosidase [Nocardioides sp. GY 10127]
MTSTQNPTTGRSTGRSTGPSTESTRTDGRADARADWEARIGQASGTAFGGNAPRLDPPTGLAATPGGHQVSLTWDLVDGAIGYQVHVADSPDGPWGPLDHAGRDVLAVPHPPYVDTTGTPGETRWYAVTSLSDVHVEGPRSAAVTAAPLAAPVSLTTVEVDAGGDAGPLARPWRPMIGAEHLSHALSTDTTGGRSIGGELSSALKAAHDELGVRTVRAHGILCDDNAVYREVDGEPVHDFTGVDRVYDHILSLGLKPVVEISFMPRDLATDPDKTVFDYDAIISPPKSWDRWYQLVRDLTAHLLERYGEEVVTDWSFEVWNEANLEVFWSGTPEQYLRLYDVTAAAVRDVDQRLVVGGPSSAAAGWVEELLAHAERTGSPVDFVSTHTYGSPPLDFRPMLERYGRGGTPIWWTEWGVTPTHFNEVSDAVFAGTFLLRGMASAMDRIEALSYWVVSDHFEELGRPEQLTHGGFGLRTVGELRKPRWWALAMLERLGDTRLPVTLGGDGGGSLVEAVAARQDDGVLGVLAWNLTLDQTKASGDPALARETSVRLTGLVPGARYTLSHERVDADHSDVTGRWGAMKDPDQAWPTEAQWSELRAHDHLEHLEPTRSVTVGDDGSLEVTTELPMPSMSLLTLTPEG